MSVALLSQAKKSECGIAQPSFYIDGNNVLNDRHSPLSKTRALFCVKQNLVQTDKQTNRHTGLGIELLRN